MLDVIHDHELNQTVNLIYSLIGYIIKEWQPSTCLEYCTKKHDSILHEDQYTVYSFKKNQYIIYVVKKGTSMVHRNLFSLTIFIN